MLGGIVLSVVGFPPSVDAAGVPPDVVFRMGVCMGPILGTLHMIPILLYLLYRLDRRRHAEIHAQLEDLRESRKRAEEPEVPLVAAGS